MVTLKIIFDTRRKKSDLTYPIIFRVTEVKKVLNLYSDISVLSEFWDSTNRVISKTHPNSKSLNLKLSKRFYELQKIIVTLEAENDFTFNNFKQALNSKDRTVARTTTFYDFSLEIINQMIADGRVGNAIVYKTAVNRLTEFHGNRNLTFKQIDFSLLDSFKREIIRNGCKPNTIGNYLRSIRAIYNRAIKSKIIDRAFYPFTDISIKTERTAKRAISKDELLKLNSISLEPGTRKWDARNYFLLSFSLIGISFTDLAYLKKGDIKKDRIVFKRKKTYKDYDIKVSPLCKSLFENYSNECSDYLIPILNNTTENTIEAKKVIAQWIKTTNKSLKELGKEVGLENLTTYVSRHTWATTAKRLGYSNELIAEALGHEYGNKITNIYLDSFEQQVVDDLNDKVLEGLTN